MTPSPAPSTLIPYTTLFRSENSVRDIAAFLDRLAADPGLDASRIGVTGGSYGGYMCYASAIHYGARLKGANCAVAIDRKSTRPNSSHGYSSYAVFCLK